MRQEQHNWFTISSHLQSQTVFSFIIFIKYTNNNKMHKALDFSLIEMTTISGWPKGGCGRLMEVSALDYYFWSLIMLSI